MRLVKVGLAALDTSVGDCAGNVGRAVGAARALAADGASVALFPQRAVGGAPARGLSRWAGLLDAQWEALRDFARQTSALPLVSVLGVEVRQGGALLDCAAVVGGGVIHGLVPRERAARHDEEGFARGRPGQREVHRGVPLGDVLFRCDFGLVSVLVGGDLWSACGPAQRRALAGAELTLCLASAPFVPGAAQTRRGLVGARAVDAQGVFAWVNQAGAQDGVVFDGGGFICDGERLALELPRFGSGHGAAVVDLGGVARRRASNPAWAEDAAAVAPAQVVEVPVATHRDGLTYPAPPGGSDFMPAAGAAREAFCEEVLDALALGIGDYYEKSGAFSRLGLALSGGRDSLLTLLIAHRWASRAGVPIETFYMPTRNSSTKTRDAAALIAGELGVKHTVVPLDEAFEREVEAVKTMLPEGVPPTPVTVQNVQARLRSERMWNWANTSGALFLQTGNLSEKAMGYCTVGGDLMGALAVIAGLPKTVVVALLEHLHAKHGYRGIAATFEQPAGPELSPGQRGEDELMPFAVLDACIALVVRDALTPAEAVEAMAPRFPDVARPALEAFVAKFARHLSRSVFKWVQSPVALQPGLVDDAALDLPALSRPGW